LKSQEYIEGVLSGDRKWLAQAITLVESTKEEHHVLAREVVQACLPKAGNSVRVGITGVPGVGKSTFIETLGKHVTASGKKLAVLAIDPSSQKSGGSILGDKTRMEELAANENAFIRPSPASGALGGVANATRESIILCEAAGYDIIFVETVGVGQSETTVHSMVDFFLLLMLAGAGDELQGIKRGIMEMADTIAINKADGDNEKAATQAQAEYKSALHLFPPSESGWMPRVETCSALNGSGIETIWQIIEEHNELFNSKGLLTQKRQQQTKSWLKEAINHELESAFYNNASVSTAYPEVEQQVLDGKLSALAAAHSLIDNSQS